MPVVRQHPCRQQHVRRPYGFGAGVVSFYAFNANPTVSNSEIENNIFYNDTDIDPIYIDSSSGFTPGDWHIDYNDRSGGSSTFHVDGSTYTQTHSVTCQPVFARYVKDTTPYSSSYQSLGSDLSISSTDTCVRNAGTALTGLFNTDKDGNSRPQTGSWDIGAYQHTN